ncbi:MAG: transcriptional regulator [Gammaproteobacteria bacterium]|nr:transcriptional regulator [Gammaproteobacteria bacterium]
MESTRPIRALARGLDALTVLNSRDGASVSEVSQEIRLPRTTVYRILETLCNAGFVFRDSADDRYRLTIRVRGLSEGFDDEAWVSQIAKPAIEELGREIVWPVSVATLSGTVMMVRESTDHTTPLAVERYSAGLRLPLLTSAAGRAYLAFCPAPLRETLVDQLNGQSAELQRLLADIQAQGYATATRTRRLVDEASIGVPVISHGDVLAVLTMRFMASAIPLKSGLERFLPKLRQCAAKISTLLPAHPASSA